MYSNAQTQTQGSRIMKNQVNRTVPKETNQAPITDPGDRELFELSDKEFRAVLSNNVSKLQEHRQLNNVRETIHEQNEKFNKEIET